MTRLELLSGQGRASVPFCRRRSIAWVRLVGNAQVSAQGADTGLPPRGGRRARLGIISGCPQIVPVSPRCPATKSPARWHQAPLQMLAGQRRRNPRSRSPRGPNRWNHCQYPLQCRLQCHRRRRRNPARSRDHCRRRNRNRSRSQYRTRSRTRSRCRRRRRQRSTRSAATSSPSGAGPRTHAPAATRASTPCRRPRPAPGDAP